MQTTRLALDQMLTARTVLPTLAVRQFLHCFRLLIFLAESSRMCLLSAVSTRPATAFLAYPNITYDNPRR